MGKKQKKPGKGREKTEKKTVKSIEKKIRREERLVGEEDDVDAILAKIQKEDAKKREIVISDNVDPPSARCNCSVTLNPSKDSEFILFGGEYYNGDKTYVYGDLYRFNIEKTEWRHVSSPNTPPPRSAHQAVALNNSLFIFGGEFTSPNQERFHHYKDLWRLDLTTNAWEQLQLPGGPSPRSGHRMVLWKHKLLMFGGFYDTLREVRYYNDLFVLDLDTLKWVEVKIRPGSAWPSPRSACQLAVSGDELFLYGGYFKAPQKQDKEESEKGIVHNDMWMLDLNMWEWNKVRKLGNPPDPRAGFSLAVHKKRAILFGGVVDNEKKDVIRSRFLNDLYIFQMEARRWYTMQLRVPKSQKGRVNQPAVESVQNQSSSGGREATMDDSETRDAAKDPGSVSETLEKLNLSSQGTEQEGDEAPCGRMNSVMMISGNTMYLYGGIMELGDQEVTLDDLYGLDLAKLDKWRCIIEASYNEWVEEEEEEGDGDDDEQKSRPMAPSGDKGGSGEDDEDDDEDDDVDNDDPTSSDFVKNAAAILRGEGKKMSRSQRKEEMERIRSELGLADSDRTPQPGESLREFFARTNVHWQKMAFERTHNTGKELRRDGFDLCEYRFFELQPLLNELEKLEAEQKMEEEDERKLKQRHEEKNKKAPRGN